MEMAKKEVEMIQDLVKTLSENQLEELSEARLVLVGGGSADPIFA